MTEVQTVNNNEPEIKVAKETVQDEKIDNGPQYHMQPIDDVLKSVNSQRNGLTKQERLSRLQKNGKNVLTDSKRKSPLQIFLKAQFELFAGLLWVATVICFIVYGISMKKDISGQDYNLYLAICLMIINVFGGTLSFVQTMKSQKTLDAFTKLIPSSSLVLEDGEVVEVETANIVIGDIVIIKNGQKCPADIRLFEVNQLKVDLSSFTGEVEPQARTLENKNEIVLNATNMGFYTSPVIAGDGKGVVVEVGDKTQIGQQKKSISDVKVEVTPIQQEIHKLVVFITVISIIIGVLFFILGTVLGISIINSFLFSISIIVANVPEGLSLSITVTLSLAAKRMAKKNVLVKSLNDVETLGSVSVICSDKTGTITRNQMTVSHTFDCVDIKEVMWNFAKELPTIDLKSYNKPLIDVLALNSRCEFDTTDPEPSPLKKRTFGDASESGILRFTSLYFQKSMQKELGAYRTAHSKKFEVPFSSVYKFQLSVHKYDDKFDLVTLKGAPEKVLKASQKYQSGEEIKDIDDEFLQHFQTSYEQVAGLGERVIGLAYSYNPIQDKYENPEEITSPMVFLGFVSLVDPPKDGVVEAVTTCSQASVQVTMVTGDHYLTATAIAKQVGILQTGVDYYIDPKSVDLENKQSYQMDGGNLPMSCISCTATAQHAQLMNRLSSLPSQFIPRRPNTGSVMTGDFLAEIDDDQLMIFLDTYKCVVFARTTPEQKLRIVTAYQNLFKIVAVSGDGLNDAPALKKANVGVAMASGSEIARDAANLVLVDDSFASIVEGVKEGRLIFENLKKSMAYAITTTTPELMPFLLFVICGFPNALSSIVIILIDIATSIWPSFAMGYEVGEADLMLRPPRTLSDKMFSKQVCWHSYVRTGMFQALSVLIMFMVVVSEEFKKYSGITMSWSNFSKFNHDDFPTETLKGLVTNAWAQITVSGVTLPKEVTESADQQLALANYIFYMGQTASFVAIVETQIAHALVGRMRMNSMKTQGFFTNRGIYYTIAVMIGVSCFFIYAPFLHKILSTRNLDFIYWVYTLPFAFYLALYDELRRLIIRKTKEGNSFRRFIFW
ncbi:Sodium/potassium-transporting_ATPase alpha chain [Hexamita inflata]|uniref:Sodium/potassium-transporting ATPase alpha chain n=1 Tax=Hexamita inflata TaxID=28002 RepID=A0AA86TZW8_9EUKA|nr:Sodium/potassium-transporting ATPase alpha chain [Hexamita inflata]